MSQTLIASIFSGSLWQIVSSTSAFGLFILTVLTIMSFVSWVIIFHKWRQFRDAEKENLRFQHHFERTHRLADCAGHAKANNNSPISRIFQAGYVELNLLKEMKNQGGALQTRINPLGDDDFDIVEMAMERSLTEQIGLLEKKVIFLASTANSAPFMGLLGTVVGIMESFWAIGERGSASLAVVAPGIAEAQLAPIVGLGAAIPAVIAFNWANNKLKFLNDFAGNFILSFMSQAKKEAR